MIVIHAKVHDSVHDDRKQKMFNCFKQNSYTFMAHSHFAVPVRLAGRTPFDVRKTVQLDINVINIKNRKVNKSASKNNN